MKTKWIIPVLVSLVGGMMAFATARHITCRHGAVCPDRLADVSFLTGELKLSADQARQMQSLHAALAARLNECCARHCEARARLGRALANEADDGVAAKAILADMCRAYEEGEMATLDNLRHVRAVLNAEQKRRFDAMIGECLCGEGKCH